MMNTLLVDAGSKMGYRPLGDSLAKPVGYGILLLAEVNHQAILHFWIKGADDDMHIYSSSTYKLCDDLDEYLNFIKNFEYTLDLCVGSKTSAFELQTNMENLL